MNVRDAVSRLLVVLEHARSRPGMYCSSVETAHFLFTGIAHAMNVWFDFSPFQSYLSVYVERGWTSSPNVSWTRMREAGMDEMEIINEMFTIEIIVWQRVLEKLDDDRIQTSPGEDAK